MLGLKLIHVSKSGYRTPVPVVNNPSRSKMPWLNIGWFLSVPGGELTNRMFIVRGGPVRISCGLTVEFCVEKQFNVGSYLVWLLGGWMYYMNRGWHGTWHHSKLAVDEVSFFRAGLRVVLLQLYNTTRWSCRHAGLGCHGPVNPWARILRTIFFFEK